MVSRKSAKWYRRQSYYRVGHALTNAISPEIGSECWDGQNQQFSQNVRFRAYSMVSPALSIAYAAHVAESQD